jgi:PAS domain S-box-containing protein
MRRVSFVVLALAGALVLFVSATAYRRLGELREASGLVEHTLRVQADLTGALALLTDAETGQRGYLLTGSPSYLQPYDTAVAALPGHLAHVRELIADNPAQQERLARLDRLARSRLAELAATIAARKSDGPQAAVRLVAAGEGKRTMDDIRAGVGAMIAEEGRLLAERNALQSEHGRAATQTIVASLLLALAFVTAAMALLASAARERERESMARATAEQVARAIAASEEQLRVTLQSIGDAVVTTDDQGRVTLLNPMAEALTGWRGSEAAGRRLEDVLVLVNEESRRPAENPVARVLRDGVIAGLANHTVLIAKAGREIPIDDSAAPIRAADGRMVGAVMVFRDISERRRHEQDLRRLAAIVGASEDAIFAKTIEGTILSWNRGAERMLGYAASEVVGRPITLLTPAERLAEEAALLRRVAAGERVDAFDTERVAKDGRHVPVSVSLSPLTSNLGTIVGVSTIARDISEQARLLAAERAARAEADQANRTKDQFLAILSHELRQPLNTLLGCAGALRRQRLDPEGHERALDAIDRSMRALTRMIDDLLDIARIKAGKLALQRRPVSVGPLVAETLDAVQHEAKAKGLTFETALGPTPAIVSADADRLRQVLMNLLSNAMKYTPAGGRVQVRATTDDGRVRIAVTDSGVGIDRDFLPHVFERFRQADSRPGGTQGGLGLGLAIVREIVEMHGGSVRAQSEGRDRGATFVVELPTVSA